MSFYDVKGYNLAQDSDNIYGTIQMNFFFDQPTNEYYYYQIRGHKYINTFFQILPSFIHQVIDQYTSI